MSRRPIFARDTLIRPFKNRRTFDSFWQIIVRDSPQLHTSPSPDSTNNKRHLRHYGPVTHRKRSRSVSTEQEATLTRSSVSGTTTQHPRNSPPPPAIDPAKGLTCPSSSHRTHRAPHSPPNQPLRLCRYIFTAAPPPPCPKFRTAELISPAPHSKARTLENISHLIVWDSQSNTNSPTEPASPPVRSTGTGRLHSPAYCGLEGERHDHTHNQRNAAPRRLP